MESSDLRRNCEDSLDRLADQVIELTSLSHRIANNAPYRPYDDVAHEKYLAGFSPQVDAIRAEIEAIRGQLRDAGFSEPATWQWREVWPCVRLAEPFSGMSQWEIDRDANAGWSALRREITFSKFKPMPAEKTPEFERKWTWQEVDAEMRRRLAVNPRLIEQSQRAWADLIGCKVGLVRKVLEKDFWRGLPGRPAATPKVGSLTDRVESVAGDRDEALDALIREQTADLEDSPLVVSPRRVHTAKRL